MVNSIVSLLPIYDIPNVNMGKDECNARTSHKDNKDGFF